MYSYESYIIDDEPRILQRVMLGLACGQLGMEAKSKVRYSSYSCSLISMRNENISNLVVCHLFVYVSFEICNYGCTGLCLIY